MNTTRYRQLMAVLLGTWLAGCAITPDDRQAARDSLQEALTDAKPADSTPPAAPPAAVRDALLPPIQLHIAGAETLPAEVRFDVKVRDVAAGDFFLSLVEGTPYNVVVHPEVSGTLSLDVKNITVPEVMELVRDSHGYDFERHGNSFRILPNTLQTRIFPVDYLHIKRSGTTKINAGATQITKSGSGSSSTGGDSSSTTSTSESSVITTESLSDFWTELDNNIKAILGEAEGRLVSVSPQSGVVVVRAMPNELRAVQRYLDATRRVVGRQVILEARILEVELADGFQSGINWSSLAAAEEKTLVLGQVGGGSLFAGTGLSSIAGAGVTMYPPTTTPRAGTNTTAFGGMFTAALRTDNFTAFLELLKSQGDVHVLSSPRIATMNNQKAVIKVGSDEFFVTDVNTTTTTTTTSTVPNVSVELTPFFSGVTLDVTPQISEGGDIILHVRPSVSEVREQTKDVTVTSTTLRMPLAASTIRESDSIIRALNGQIVVIGGLMQNRMRDETAAVPLLGDIPVVGELFRHRRQAKAKSELVILLKPTVVESGEQWSQELRNFSSGYRALERMD